MNMKASVCERIEAGVAELALRFLVRLLRLTRQWTALGHLKKIF